MKILKKLQGFFIIHNWNQMGGGFSKQQTRKHIKKQKNIKTASISFKTFIGVNLSVSITLEVHM